MAINQEGVFKGVVKLNGGTDLPSNLSERELYVQYSGEQVRLFAGVKIGDEVLTKEVTPYKLNPAQYGETLPATGEEGQLFFKVVTSNEVI